MLRAFFFFLIQTVLVNATQFPSCSQEHGIVQKAAHIHNRDIVQLVMGEELANLEGLSPDEKAFALNKNISELASKIMSYGFDPDAYQPGHCKETGYLFYVRIPIWEGGLNDEEEIPLTLFVYAWPPARHARSYDRVSHDPFNCFYGSCIHAHPILCAFQVLKGSLDQITYDPLPDWPYPIVKKRQQEHFTLGQGAVDDQLIPFIHEMFSDDERDDPAISLHSYGMGTAREVVASFCEAYTTHCYRYVLEADGSITTRTW